MQITFLPSVLSKGRMYNCVEAEELRAKVKLVLTGLSPLNTYQDQVRVKKVIVIDETKISAESRARHTLLVVFAVEEPTT